MYPVSYKDIAKISSYKIVDTSQFEQKILLLKSMGKLFPHPVGVFCTMPNPPKSYNSKNRFLLANGHI